MAKSGWKESGNAMFRWPASALAAIASAALIFAQSDGVIRVNVNLVNVIATVRNASGELVGSLKKDDFEIFDNGVRQEIAMLQRQADQPLSIALLIDTSGSTAKDLKYETDSASRFLSSLLQEGHPEDAVALYSFNWVVREEKRFTHNYRSLETSLKALHGEAGTALYDAMWHAARDLEPRQGRKAMVVITDG